MAIAFRSKEFTCPFFQREAKTTLSCEGCTIHAPERRSLESFEDKYCASDAVSWKKCHVARMLLEFYEKD